MIVAYVLVAIWVQELNIPIMVYAVSVGPLKNSNNKKLLVELFNKIDVITVRENESKRLLHDLGVTQEVQVTADPALLIKEASFKKEMLKNEGVDPEIPLVGFSVREPGPAAPNLNIDHYHFILAKTADFMVERFDSQVLFIPMEKSDLQHSHAIISKMENTRRAGVLKNEYSSPQILSLIGHMHFAVGMRLHFLMFSGMQGVPFVPLAYASKVKGLLQDLDLPYTPMESWNTGSLCASIDRGWDSRKSVQKKLQQKIPEIQLRAKQNNKILCEYLKKLNKS